MRVHNIYVVLFISVSRSVYDIREDIRALSSTVAGFSDTMFQEFSQIAQKV